MSSGQISASAAAEVGTCGTHDAGTAVPVVLLHGMRVSQTMWRPLAAALAQDRRGRPRQVATPDLPGHGRLSQQPFTLADAVRLAVEAIGEPALLVGHSLGGFIAFATAARHPHLVRGVIAIGASSRPTRVGQAVYAAYGSLLAAHPGRGARFSDATAARMLPPDVFDAWTAGGYSHERAPEVVAEISASDPLADVAGFTGPLWLLNGSLDQFRLGEHEFLEAAPAGRLVVWPGYNHVSILGATARLATFVEDACAVVDDR